MVDGVEFGVEFVPIDADQVEAWREAVRILLGLLLEIDPDFLS